MDRPAKSHRGPTSGPKAKRRREINRTKHAFDPTSRNESKPQINQKAFSMNNPVKVAHERQRKLDREQKRHHVPMQKREVEGEEPPLLVAVVGPAGVGKSTLIHALVKHYTGRNARDVNGPLTLVSGKKRRLTLFECPRDDACAMLDLAKTADVILMLIDASVGFEMITFEFLNMAQTHGMPKIMGVLTHLDMFQNVAKLQKVKRELKTRFWSELYDGAKLFHLSGVRNDKSYPRQEISNLARFISVLKVRPLAFRSSHPYVVADRVERLDDGHSKDDKALTHRVALYGYIRGTNLCSDARMHLLGVNDFTVMNITSLDDPCPLPVKEEGAKRRLKAKEKVLYAPMSNIGDLVYDKDAIYIDLKHQDIKFSELSALENGVEAKPLSCEGAGEKMVKDMHHIEDAIDERIARSTVKLFKNSTPMSRSDIEQHCQPLDTQHDSDANDDSDECDEAHRSNKSMSDENDDDDDDDDDDENDDDDDDENDDDDDDAGSHASNSKFVRAPIAKESDESDDEDIDLDSINLEWSYADNTHENSDNDERVNASNLRWKHNLTDRAAQAHKGKQNLEQLIYDVEIKEDCTHDDDDDDDDDDDGNFFRVRDINAAQIDEDVSVRPSYESEQYEKFDDESVRAQIKQCFVTGDWHNKSDTDNEDIEHNSYNDCDTVHSDNNDDDDDDDDDDDEHHGITVDDECKIDETEKEACERRTAAKVAKKIAFDAEHDQQDEDEDEDFYSAVKAEMAIQKQRNLDEFADEDVLSRVRHEGLRCGKYVRIEIDGVPAEFITNFDAKFPCVVGGILAGEDKLGFLQVRLKKHRWYSRVLKNEDALIVSVGWRRFQTMPLFSTADANGRQRMLKYTPEHMHCQATMFAPVLRVNSGIICLQTLQPETNCSFRIAATGVVTEVDNSFGIVKKLKLVGTPLSIKRNTAFIKDMFNSEVEAARFEGAKIRTVSGIRGQIKKGVGSAHASTTADASNSTHGNGIVRCTFEDRVLHSDIVFCRTWMPVNAQRFYNPVTNALGHWRAMRLVRQIRRDNHLPIPLRQDSEYQANIERKKVLFYPLRIPKNLQRDLPFASKPKLEIAKTKESKNARSTSVVFDNEQKRVATLVNRVNAVRNQQLRKRREKKQKTTEAKRKRDAVQQKVFDDIEKEKKKRKYAREGALKMKAERASKHT